jgi:hypothetical protein
MGAADVTGMVPEMVTVGGADIVTGPLPVTDIPVNVTSEVPSLFMSI